MRMTGFWSQDATGAVTRAGRQGELVSSGRDRMDLETETKTKTKPPDQVVKQKHSHHLPRSTPVCLSAETSHGNFKQLPHLWTQLPY